MELLNIDKLNSEVASKTTLLYSLANIMEGYIVDIKSTMLAIDVITQTVTKKQIYAFDIKKAVNAIHRNTVLLRQDLTKHYKDNEKFKLDFGANTDLLEDTIKDVIKEKVGFQ
jgi:hypothetical protein